MKVRRNLRCCLKLLTLVQTNVEYDDDDALGRIFLSSFK